MIEKKGGEVTVPAGTFETTKVTVVDKSRRKERTSVFYYTPEVPLTMVKSENPDGGNLELIEYGDGAESEITGEVKKIEIPNLEELLGK